MVEPVKIGVAIDGKLAKTPLGPKRGARREAVASVVLTAPSDTKST
jgi:hypothetical protein